MKKIFIIVLIFVISGKIYSQQIIYDSLIHDSIQREYLLFLPKNYNAKRSYPVIFNFHGYTQSPVNYMEDYSDFRNIANNNGVILIYPKGSRGRFFFAGYTTVWNVKGEKYLISTADDIGFVDILIEMLHEKYNIDLNRLYATGFSNGGFFSNHLACFLSSRFAAIASVSGTMTPYTLINCNPGRPIPVMHIHGGDDHIIPYSGNSSYKAVDSLIGFWVENNVLEQERKKEINVFDSNEFSIDTIEHFIYNCKESINVELYKISNGSHTWFEYKNPVNFSSCRLIWDFFSKYDINGYNPIKINNITETSIQNSIIYPNPTSGVIKAIIKTGYSKKYRLLNIYGRTIVSGKFNSELNEINISRFPNGIYILTIGDENFKIIKK